MLETGLDNECKVKGPPLNKVTSLHRHSKTHHKLLTVGILYTYFAITFTSTLAHHASPNLYTEIPQHDQQSIRWNFCDSNSPLFLVDRYSSSSAVDNNPMNNETLTQLPRIPDGLLRFQLSSRGKTKPESSVVDNNPMNNDTLTQLPPLPDKLLRFSLLCFQQSSRGKTKPENTLHDYSQLWYEHNMPCEDCFSKDEPTCPHKTIR